MSDFLSEKKNLSNAMKDIEKRFGKGSVMLMTSETDKTLEFFSSGSITIDKALGGGFPKGRIIEIYGPESSGKTTLALEAMAEVQKGGGVVAFVDVEHALDPAYAKRIGVKMDELIFSQPDTGEQALEIVEALVRSGEVSMVVLDSVAALVPEAEINGDMGASHVGLHARLMSQAMRKLSGIVSKTNTTVLFINQIREKVGIMFGNPETTTGGRALKFYASQRLEIRKGEIVKIGTEIVGGQMRVKVVKNKVAPPYKEAKVSVVFGKGIDADAEVVELGAELDIIKKAGSWLSYDKLKSQGTENFKLLLLENPEILNEIREKIKEAL